MAVALGVVGLAAYLAAAIGVSPSPAYLARLFGHAAASLGMADEPSYPCQGGACACGSAHECWTTCQCHTLAQKVAWARQHHVPVPDYVDLSPLESTVAQKPAKAKPACPLCCAAETDDAAPTSAAVEPEGCEAETSDRSGLPTLTALGCKGLQTLLASVVVPVVAQPAHLLFANPTRVYQAIPYDCGRLAWRSLEVTPPPPRG